MMNLRTDDSTPLILIQVRHKSKGAQGGSATDLNPLHSDLDACSFNRMQEIWGGMAGAPKR